jgi:FG-GAP repeat/Uncharacterised ACR (DUF711)/Lectin C-type domain
LTGIIADELALGMVNHKTTAVRVIPVPGKGPGEKVEWGGLLGTAIVQDPGKFSCAVLLRDFMRGAAKENAIPPCSPKLMPKMISMSSLRPALVLIVLLALPAAGASAQETKLLPGDGAAVDQFGGSVAISGTTAIVSAYTDDDNGSDSGSAYLFDMTTGLQLAKLLPADGAAFDLFGFSVAISGTTVIVGAPGDDDNGISSGSAYLFDTTTGLQLAKLLAADGAAGDQFGVSVAITDATAIVGATGDDNDSGAAYLFDTATGVQLAKLVPTDGAAFDNFGFSVALSGTTAIVGALGDDDNGSDSGSSYLFDTTSGLQLAKLLPADGAEDDLFGLSVALDGTTAVVGALLDDDHGPDSGSAYLFDTVTGLQVAKLLPTDGTLGDQFGQSVAISGTTAIIGAILDDDSGVSSGSAYLFDTATGLQLAKLLPADGAADDRYGVSVSISDTTAIVGAYLDDDNGANSGSAYAFPLSPLWSLSPVNGNWYTEVDPLSWSSAEAAAQAWGGHLATIRSQAENDWVRDNYATTSAVWIGYTDQELEGSFEWISGEAGVFENWTVGEPDDLLGADWAALRPGAGTWSDEPSLPEHPGVVEVISDDCDGNGLPDTYEIALDPALDWNGDGLLDDCVSANYCTAANNSTGIPGVVGVSGSPVLADDTFTLEAWDLPSQEFAYFLMSESTAFVPGFGGSSGNLCLGSPIVRLNNPSDGGSVLNTGATGTVSFTLDLNNLPQAVTFIPSSTWYFQLWYRDFTVSPTSNTTDGIGVLFR